jgi:putative endonuclease
MSLDSKNFGKEGEDAAVFYLEKKNYRILKRNYHYSNIGEIDIIAKEGDVFVFVEVKSRKNLNFGEPEYAVTKSKIEQIKKIANAYLYNANIVDVDCRFDVITILDDEFGKRKINHIINAFE